jgi:hypothetical protein
LATSRWLHLQSQLRSLCREEDATRSVHRGGASVPLLSLLHCLAAVALDAGIWVSMSWEGGLSMASQRRLLALALLLLLLLLLLLPTAHLRDR